MTEHIPVSQGARKSVLGVQSLNMVVILLKCVFQKAAVSDPCRQHLKPIRNPS